MGIARTTCQYKAKPIDDKKLQDALTALTAKHAAIDYLAVYRKENEFNDWAVARLLVLCFNYIFINCIVDWRYYARMDFKLNRVHVFYIE